MLAGLLAAALALAPGLLTWVWGRRLVGAIEDPTLPERVMAWRNRSAAAFAGGAAFLLVMLPRHAPWAVPLLVFCRLAGGFPTRRALFGESWDFVAYLAQLARWTFGIGGFWLLLLAAPALIALAGPHTWPVAGALAGGLVAWGLAYSRILVAVTGARPLLHPQLAERFRAIAERSTAPMPRLWVVGHPGGRTANALALPATRSPLVLFTRTLLEAFDTDETAAIFAHEQAHLEHFNPGRVRRLAALQTIAVLVGTLGAAAALQHLEGRTTLIIWTWPLLVMVAGLVRLVRHKAHETASDRRAVELCGDAGALARALVKLHSLALLPRRMAVELESHATHPSLANRLRAIEGGSPEKKAPPSSGAARAASPRIPAGRLPAIARGSGAGSWVVLDTRQAHWLESVPEGTPRTAEALRAAAPRGRSLAYSELVELRLEPKARGHALVASDRNGVAWSMPLAPEDARFTQAALDAVDHLLAPPTAARPERKLLSAIVACAGTLVSLVAWSAAWLPALMGIVLPHPGPLAAFGAGALAGTVVSLVFGVRTGPVFDPELAGVARVALVVCGAAALWLAHATAWRERAGRTRTAPWVALGLTLAGLGFLALPTVGFWIGGVLRSHVAARDHPGGAVLLIAAAGALLVVPRSWGRAGAAVVGGLGLVPLILGSPLFASRFVCDPFFVADAPTASSTRLTLELAHEESLPAASGQLELSPSGTSWAIREFEIGDGSEPPVHRMVVGSESGARYSYDASDLFLLDDARLLALYEDPEGTSVELRPHDPDAPALWRVELDPLLSGAQIAAQPRTGRWRVSGTHAGSGRLVRVSGEVDGTYSVESWEPELDGAVWVVSDGPAALGIASRRADMEEELLERGLREDSPSLFWLLAGYTGPGFGSRILALDADGPHELFDSELLVQCDAPPPGERQLLCRASDGARTTLWQVNPADGRRRPVASVEGTGWPAQPDPRGWLLQVTAGRGQDLYLLEDGRLLQVELPGAPPWIQAVAGYDGGVGVLVFEAVQRSRLRRYGLP